MEHILNSEHWHSRDNIILYHYLASQNMIAKQGARNILYNYLAKQNMTAKQGARNILYYYLA